MQAKKLYPPLFSDLYNSYLIGALLAGWVGYVFALKTLLFFFNYQMGVLDSWAGAILYFVAAFFFIKKDGIILSNSLRVFIILICLLLITISFVVSGYFIDYSYDGQCHLGEAIRLIYNGWNPNYEHFTDANLIVTWINHYSKSTWVAGGYFYKMTGLFEYAKSGNTILMFANFFLALPLFKKLFSRTGFAVLYSALLAMNPIWLNMYLSNMHDSQVANSMFIILLILYYHFTEKQWRTALPVFYLIVFYFLNIKFTAVGYYVVFGAVVVGYLIFTRRFKDNIKLILHTGIAFLLGFLFSDTIPTFRTPFVISIRFFHLKANTLHTPGLLWAMLMNTAMATASSILLNQILPRPPIYSRKQSLWNTNFLSWSKNTRWKDSLLREYGLAVLEYGTQPSCFSLLYIFCISFFKKFQKIPPSNGKCCL